MENFLVKEIRRSDTTPVGCRKTMREQFGCLQQSFPGSGPIPPSSFALADFIPCGFCPFFSFFFPKETRSLWKSAGTTPE